MSMNEANGPAERVREFDPSQKLVVTDKNFPLSPGRRPFFFYRDLGLKDVTNGKVSATLTSTSKGLSRPTGWHYHVCEVQFIYMLDGWVDLEFEDGTARRLSAGDSIYIPSGMRHNEIATSESFELLEIQIPSGMQTVTCEPPVR